MSTETGSKKQLVLTGRVKAPVSGYDDIMRFRPGPGSPWQTIRLEQDAGDIQARRDLHWAGTMDEDVEITVLADPEGPGAPLVDDAGRMSMTHHLLRDRRCMAEKLAGRSDWQKLLPDLAGLMKNRVLSTHPREMSRVSLEFVEAHEVILWEDGSITTIEHSTDGITGAFQEQRVLPHMTGADLLLEHEEQGAYGEPRERQEPGGQAVESLIDYGALRHVLERIVPPGAGNAPPTSRAAARRALLGPAMEMATLARAELGRRISRGGEE